MNEIPEDSSFTKHLDYVHVVIIAFRNDDNKLELGVWGYKTAEDANLRFQRIMETHKKYEATGRNSPLISTETFMVGIYENFEQSLFVEVSPRESERIN